MNDDIVLNMPEVLSFKNMNLNEILDDNFRLKILRNHFQPQLLKKIIYDDIILRTLGELSY